MATNKRVAIILADSQKNYIIFHSKDCTKYILIQFYKVKKFYELYFFIKWHLIEYY